MWRTLQLYWHFISYILWSNEHCGSSNYWLLNCLFNSLLRLTTKRTLKFHIIGNLWEESTSDHIFPPQWAAWEDSWWRHQMETFSALLAICGQWRGALMFSLICVWINGWVNNCEAGVLRCYRAHYDVSVMLCGIIKAWIQVRVSAVYGNYVCMLPKACSIV